MYEEWVDLIVDVIKKMNVKVVSGSMGKNEKICIYFSPSGGFPRLLCNQTLSSFYQYMISAI